MYICFTVGLSINEKIKHIIMQILDKFDLNFMIHCTFVYKLHVPFLKQIGLDERKKKKKENILLKCNLDDPLADQYLNLHLMLFVH